MEAQFAGLIIFLVIVIFWILFIAITCYVIKKKILRICIYVGILLLGIGWLSVDYWKLQQMNSAIFLFSSNNVEINFIPKYSGNYSVDLYFQNEKINQAYEPCEFDWIKANKTNCKNALIYRGLNWTINDKKYSAKNSYGDWLHKKLEFGFNNYAISGKPSLSVFKFFGAKNIPIKTNIKIDATPNELLAAKPIIIIGPDEELYDEIDRHIGDLAIIGFLFAIVILFMTLKALIIFIKKIIFQKIESKSESDYKKILKTKLIFKKIKMTALITVGIIILCIILVAIAQIFKNISNIEYAEGRGQYNPDSNNNENAISLLQKAVAKGNSYAANDLGYYYSTGKGVKKDLEKAKKYFKIAADGGDSLAMYNLGFTYSNFNPKNSPEQVNLQQAISWYKKSMQTTENYCAANDLGFLYATGVGVNKDMLKAKEYFYKSGSLLILDIPEVQQKLVDGTRDKNSLLKIYAEYQYSRASQFNPTLIDKASPDTMQIVKFLSNEAIKRCWGN